jgi:dTDP-D-glucose 4,6-dehydratase
MKITSKTLMVGFETEVKIGNNDAIEATLIHQAFISRDKLGGIDPYSASKAAADIAAQSWVKSFA